MTHQTKLPPGAIEMHGATYLRDAKGNLVPLANIRAIDLLVDEMVRTKVGYALDLSAELARFVSHCDADVAGHDAILDQEYNVPRPEATKGNRTFTSFDGCLQVKIAVSDRIAFGPELQSAKKLLDIMILEKAEGADPFLLALVGQAFNVDQEGKVDVQSILALRRLEVDDTRWPDITRAIDDSIRVIGTKKYLRFYRRDTAQDQWQMIPLDLAAVRVTPEAFARPSLRRQVAEAEDAKGKALKALSLALTYMLDGATVTAARCIADAADALGGDLRARAEEYHLQVADLEERMAIQEDIALGGDGGATPGEAGEHIHPEPAEG